MRSILLFSLFFSSLLFAQNKDSFALEFNYLNGNVLTHKKGLEHLITGHPHGFMMGFLKQSDGSKDWQKAYNYPEVGAYFLYQNLKNDFLGENYAAGFQFNFYFFKRNFQLKTASGIAMTTNPYHKETNSKNIAFGTKFMANINVGLSYKTHLYKQKVALQTGLFFSHYSNGRIKLPNGGINTINVNVGLVYNFSDTIQKYNDTVLTSAVKYTEPIHYNVVFRSGFNQSSVVNSGQHPFYHVGFFADKRINKKSALHLGTELFISNFFKDFIKFQSVAYPNKNVDPNTDFKRIGIFVGHELFFDKMSMEFQAGYYVYQPFKFDFPIYDRIGLKYYINKKINAGVGVKTHGFFAEALEFSIGYRL